MRFTILMTLAVFIAGCERSRIVESKPSLPVEKGTPAVPSSREAVAGDYYIGDGLGYNKSLNLNVNGSYACEWHGCLGKYGESSGVWVIRDGTIVLQPNKTSGLFKNKDSLLECQQYRGKWIFVEAGEHKFYDQYGVGRASCYQLRDAKRE